MGTSVLYGSVPEPPRHATPGGVATTTRPPLKVHIALPTVFATFATVAAAFVPGTHCYVEEKGKTVATAVARADGSVRFPVDLTRLRNLCISERPGTLVITESTTLTASVFESIVIDADGVVLDGGGWGVGASSVGGPGRWYGGNQVFSRNLSL